MKSVRISGVMFSGLLLIMAITVAVGCSPNLPCKGNLASYISKAGSIFGCRGCNQEEEQNIEETATELLARFAEADTNNDGLLSQEEAQSVIDELTAELFESLDNNNDGFLDQEELNTAIGNTVMEGEEELQEEGEGEDVPAEGEATEGEEESIEGEAEGEQEGEGESLEGEEEREGETIEGEGETTPLLYVGLMVHLEGHLIQTLEEHEHYRDQIVNYAQILEAHGAKATWEVKEPIDSCITYNDYYFKVLEEHGHGIGVHADLGYGYPPEYTYEQFVDDLAERKSKLEQQGVQVRHVSGVCSDMDWSNVVADSGYEFVTGIVEYSLMCLDESLWPEGFEACDSPATCHDPYPPTLQERIAPWRADTVNWTQQNEDGRIVIFPEGCHGLPHLAENSKCGNALTPSEKAVDFSQEDVDAYFQILDEALEIAVPGQVNTFYIGWSFGSALDETLFTQWLERLETYVDKGQVAWKTIPEMYDLYIAAETDGDEETITPVYVTVAGHIEEGLYYSDCNAYPGYRDKLLDFFEVLDDNDIPFDLQIDYPLFEGAKNCESPEMQTETGDTNALDYISQHFDVCIDPHKSGGWEEGLSENYADVHYIGGQVVTAITDNVGGVVWDNEDQYERLAGGEAGVRHPEYTWYPKILTLGVHTNHHLGNFDLDDRTSDIWKPKGFGNDFLTHDESASLVYVGPGAQHSDWFDNSDWEFNTVADYVEVLVAYIDSGKLPAEKMYTATLAVPQKIIFMEDERYKLIDQITQLKPLIDSGQVVLAHYNEVVDAWVETYNSEPNLLDFDAIDPADYTGE